MNDLAKSALVALSVFAFFSLGCINLFDDNETIARPDLSGLQCGEFTGDAPRIGFLWDELEPIGSGCEDMPIEPGFQGGFHVSPVIWIPIDMQTGAMVGVSTTRLVFTNGELAPFEQANEVFHDQWRPVADGSAIDTRIILPNQLVENGGRWDVQIDIEVEFDDVSQQNVSVSESMQIYLETP